MKKIKTNLLSLAMGAIVLCSCSKSNDDPKPVAHKAAHQKVQGTSPNSTTDKPSTEENKEQPVKNESNVTAPTASGSYHFTIQMDVPVEGIQNTNPIEFKILYHDGSAWLFKPTAIKMVINDDPKYPDNKGIKTIIFDADKSLQWDKLDGFNIRDTKTGVTVEAYGFDLAKKVFDAKGKRADVFSLSI